TRNWSKTCAAAIPSLPPVGSSARSPRWSTTIRSRSRSPTGCGCARCARWCRACAPRASRSKTRAAQAEPPAQSTREPGQAMLYISKWKAAAILLTALICCLFAVPNFFPESMVKRWPAWAQRHIVLGLDLQGGSHILLEVDVNDVRRQKLLALQDDVRRVLRE